MLSKTLIFLIISSISLIQSAELMSNLEADENTDENIEEIIDSISDSITNAIQDLTLPSVFEGVSPESISPNDNSFEKIEQPLTTEMQMITDQSEEDEFTRSTSEENEFELNVMMKKPGLGNMRIGAYTNGPGIQLLNDMEKLHEMEDHEEGIFRLVDPRTPPQTQLVDNTLRLMAIKSTADNLAMRIFPNLHVLQQAMENH